MDLEWHTRIPRRSSPRTLAHFASLPVVASPSPSHLALRLSLPPAPGSGLWHQPAQIRSLEPPSLRAAQPAMRIAAYVTKITRSIAVNSFGVLPIPIPPNSEYLSETNSFSHKPPPHGPSAAGGDYPRTVRGILSPPIWGCRRASIMVSQNPAPLLGPRHQGEESPRAGSHRSIWSQAFTI